MSDLSAVEEVPEEAPSLGTETAADAATEMVAEAPTESAAPGATAAEISKAARLHPGPQTFEAFPIGDDVREAVMSMGFSKPTLVQTAVVEAGVRGQDLLVQSKTGSGKTSAFGIPMMERLKSHGGEAHRPLGLVLLPTRELAHQVAAELRLLAAKKGTRVLAIYGGVPMGRQTTALNQGIDIVVGTPGRLLDHIRRKNLFLDGLQAVVLDEADEMLSMGFWDDVTELLKLAPASRQTMLFSATLPYEVAKAAAIFLKEPVKVDLSGDDLTVSNIENCILHVQPNMPKPRQMLYVLETSKPSNAIIFCNTRNETEMLAKFLTQSGFVAEPLSGNFKQKDRESVMGRIKSGELRYMVATDIAARGIDINDLKHVFNYSLPEFSEVYLHRVGRTGRIGKRGTAISLVDGRGLGTLTQLERVFGITFTEVKLPPEEEIILARSLRIMKDLAEKAAVAEIGQQVPVAREILANENAAQIVAYLLKTYFSGQVEALRKMSALAEGAGASDAFDQDERPRRQQAAPGQPSPRVSEAADAGEGEGEGEGGEGGRRRRRRRRGRGRGEGGAERQEDRADRPAARARGSEGEGSGGRERRPRPAGTASGMEIVDASDMLAGLSQPAAAAPRAAAQHQERPAPRHEPRAQSASASVPASPAVPASPSASASASAPVVADGMTRIRVNIGFDDGFKGRGAVAKKISALAGLNEGIITEVESRRDHAVLKATPENAELVLERVDGAQLGKKVIAVTIAS